MIIFGDSGAGKTTLINCISGLDNDYEGKIYFDDRLVDKNNQKDLENIHNKSAFVFQFFLLFDALTVEENLKIVLPSTKDVSLLYRWMN